MDTKWRIRLEAEFGIGETFVSQKAYDQASAIFDRLAQSPEMDVVVRAEFLRKVFTACQKVGIYKVKLSALKP